MLHSSLQKMQYKLQGGLVVVRVHVMKAHEGRGHTAPISRDEWSASYHGHVICLRKGPEVAKCW